MNGTATLALLDATLRDAALSAYVESGDAQRDLARAWESVRAFDEAFAAYRREFPEA
jgi:hypothetical protein